ADRPRECMAALPAHHAAAVAAGDRHRRHHAHDDRAVGVCRDLRRDRRRTGNRDRDPQSLRVPDVIYGIQPGLRRRARRRAARDNARHFVPDVPDAEGPMKRAFARRFALAASAGMLLSIWGFPVLWALLTSFKTERDVLAYPPKILFEPSLAAYRDVLFGASSIVPNLVSSIILSLGATLLTLLVAVPAGYALARLDLPARRTSGFYVLATQMLPPVGLIIPYYLVLQKVGALDTYAGLIVIYLTFSLPFAIWLLVSYFEDIPREMEEAALLDRAGRFRTLWHVILPQ